MLLTVYDRYHQQRAVLSPNDNSTQVKEIQSDNVLTLSFTLYEHVSLDVNDYVDFLGERYWLMARYEPKEVSTQEWSYDVKFYGIESLIKRFLVLKTVDGEDEPVFTLTAPPREHVAMIVGCINDGMDNTTDWKVGQVDGTENIVIDYEGKYCDEALKEIAEKVGAEYWAEGQTINVCRCEHGDEVTLAYGKGLLEIDPSTADNAKFYTRLFPIGSSKNIDREKYGFSRLQLPGKEKFVDVNADKYGIIHHYESKAFADIYPRRIGVVSSVRSADVTGEDGTPFKMFYFRDNTLNFDPNKYEIGGLVKRVSFQEGSELAGLGSEEEGTYYFEVNYNSDTREFEIITIWPYDDDTQLPNDILKPKVGDKYILWNISMPDEYYALAEEEYLTAVQKYNAQHAVDVALYKSPTDHVYIEDNGIELSVGLRVKLESEVYFPEEGYRRSRITKITRKVNLPSQMDLEISDALSTGSLAKLSGDIADVKNYTKTATSGTSLPDIIRSWDNTQPTDNNLFSARRSQKEFLNKNKPDRAKKKIIFDEGIDLGEFVEGEFGGRIDGKGNAELLTLVIRSLLRSAKFVDGLTGEGWQLWIDAEGLSNLTVDKATIRQALVAIELLIEKVRSVGGQICVSAANGKIKEVADNGDSFHITFEQDNNFEAHDLMRCATWKGGTQHGYWVEIDRSDPTGVDVLKTEFAGIEPKAGDECVLMGNTTNKKRQNLILISATEDGQPRVDVYDEVSSTNFNDCLRARLGNLDGIKDDWFPLDNQPRGNGLYSDNAFLRGTFLLVTGEDIKTKFEITEGMIRSAVEGVRQDFTTNKGFLNNPTFYDGLNKWATENETVFFLAGNKWIWANKNVLTRKGDSAIVCTDEGRNVVRIRHKYIRQANANLRSFPTFETNADGEQEAVPVYLSFFYRCAEAGTLKVEFDNVDKTGFANFNSMTVEEPIEVTEGYKQYTCNGLWNGTGDFKLSFTGDIYLYMLVLSTDRIDSLTHKYRTLFEQSERLVKISAAVFDKDDALLKETGLVVRPEGAGLYAQDGDGNIGLIGVSVEETGEDGTTKTVAKLTADNIQLEGLVTANGNFKILEDGSIEAANGKFTGEITATGGNIGGFEISPSQLLATSGTNEMLLCSYLLRFRETVKGNALYIGGDVMPPSMGGAISCPIRVEVERESDSYMYGNIGMYLSVTGSKSWDDNTNVYTGNHALYIPKGDICGFRLRTRRIGTSQTLSNLDNVILTVNTSAITITLPAEPEEGQIYMLKQMGSGSYTLQVGDSTHYINDGRSNRKSSWSISSGCWVILVWDRVNSLWCAGYTNNN